MHCANDASRTEFLHQNQMRSKLTNERRDYSSSLRTGAHKTRHTLQQGIARPLPPRVGLTSVTCSWEVIVSLTVLLTYFREEEEE